MSTTESEKRELLFWILHRVTELPEAPSRRPSSENSNLKLSEMSG
jgi:hypothetical protein